MYWLAITIVVVGVVCTSADKVTWKYCKSQDIWDMKKLSSEDGQLTLVGTPSMDISGGSYRFNVQRETPFGDVSVLSSEGDICSLTRCPMKAGTEVVIKNDDKDRFVPPGDYKVKLNVYFRPTTATEVPKEVCTDVEVAVPRRLLARTMENTCSRKFCRQSPIDIKTSSSIFELPSSNGKNSILDVQYAGDAVELTKTPGGKPGKVSYQVKTDKAPTMEFNGKAYALANVHMHTPSEHAVNGVRYPGEVHMVHKAVVARPDGDDDYLVQGIFLEHADKAKEKGGKLMSKTMQDAMPNVFDSLISPIIAQTKAMTKGTEEATATTASPTEEAQVTALEMSKEPFETSKFWMYPGSLTTPPYSADVTWVVYANPVYSAALKDFAASAEPNARPLQTTVANAEVLTFAAKKDSKM